MTRIDDEFDRFNAANTTLMKAIFEVYDDSFDYETNGETKCRELRELVLGLEKSEFATKFHKMIKKIPESCDIKCKTEYYVWAANEICMEASTYKWKNFGGDSVDTEIRVGRFSRIGGKFYYKGDDLKGINKKPDSVSAYLLEKFMRSPGFFISDEIIGVEIKGKKGKAKHRISELKKDLRKTIDNKEVIKRARRHIGHGEVTGYNLIIS